MESSGDFFFLQPFNSFRSKSFLLAFFFTDEESHSCRYLIFTGRTYLQLIIQLIHSFTYMRFSFFFHALRILGAQFKILGVSCS